MFKNKRQETLIYFVLWGLLFLTPVLSQYIRVSQSGQSFLWSEVFMVWRQYAVFFAFFLLHNHLLAPQLVYRQRRTLYFSVVSVLLACFFVYQCSNGPMHHRPKPWKDGPQLRGDRPEPPGAERRPADAPDFGPPEDMPPGSPKGDASPDEESLSDGFGDDRRPPRHRPPRPRFDEPGDHGTFGDHKKPAGERPDGGPDDGFLKAPPFVGQHDIIALIVMMLMLGANLGIKLYFKQQRDARAFDDLERQNLAQQLEYLKYQVNPHFLMNTLNNIHALVDIDAERAKSTIVELSRMLRFVLYEGNKTSVPLSRELTFLGNYIQLMRLRYTDNVAITLDTGGLENTAHEVPPLLFITFVENAFKHGVSYQHPSFIDIRLEMNNGTLRFVCRNSRIPRDEDKHGGVGLVNVRKRLELIYGESYTLNISDTAEEYAVTLTIPLATPSS